MQVKRLSLLAVTAVITITFFSVSCKKSNDTNNSATVSATINGTVYNPASSVAFYSTDSSLFEIGGFTMKTGDTTSIAIALESDFKVGTAVTDQYALNVDYTHNSKDYFAGLGLGHASLTVTALDTVNHKITGNFTGTLYTDWGSNDSVVITNGKFDTKYIVQP